jgi:hypothetical protein
MLSAFSGSVIVVEVLGVGFVVDTESWIMVAAASAGGLIVTNSISLFGISAFVAGNSCVVVLILSRIVDVDMVSAIVVVAMGRVVVVSMAITGEPIIVLSFVVMLSVEFGRANFAIISDQLFSDTPAIA